MVKRVRGRSNRGDLVEFGKVEILGEFVLGGRGEDEDRLWDLMEFVWGMVVDMLKFGVEEEEGVWFNIGMERGEIGIMYVKVWE